MTKNKSIYPYRYKPFLLLGLLGESNLFIKYYGITSLIDTIYLLGKMLKDKFSNKYSKILNTTTKLDNKLNEIKTKEDVKKEQDCIKKLWLIRLKEVELELAILMEEEYNKKIELEENKDNKNTQKKIRNNIKKEFDDLIKNVDYLVEQKDKLRTKYCNINCMPDSEEYINNLDEIRRILTNNGKIDINKINTKELLEPDKIIHEYLKKGALSVCVKPLKEIIEENKDLDITL